MKKLLLVFFAGLFMASCGTTSTVMAVYDVGLSSVKSPTDSKEQYGETKITPILENSIQKYRYEDDYIDIIWTFRNTRLEFFLRNKSNHTIKVNWDEVAYVNYNGNVSRIMHLGVKYDKRSESQGYINIPSGTYISDMILPIDNVYFQEGYARYGGYGGYEPAKWVEKALIPCYYNNKSEMEADVKSGTWIGKTVKVLFPIEIEGVKNDYSFEFKVNGVLN